MALFCVNLLVHSLCRISRHMVCTNKDLYINPYRKYYRDIFKSNDKVYLYYISISSQPT